MKKEKRWYFRRVDDDLAKKPILAGILVEKAPVHLVVPSEFVDGTKELGDDPEIEERVLPVGRVHGREVVLERERADVQECGRVLARVDEMRKPVGRVSVAPQALEETDPRGHAHEQQCDHVVTQRQVAVVTRLARRLRIEIFEVIYCFNDIRFRGFSYSI